MGLSQDKKQFLQGDSPIFLKQYARRDNKADGIIRRCLKVLGKLISKICPIFMVPEDNPVNEEKYLDDKLQVKSKWSRTK